MSSVAKERLTISLTPSAISFLDRFKKQRRLSRSCALELLIEERRRQEERRTFAREAQVFFSEENPGHREESDALEHAALEDWKGRKD